jgi:hypothetical protein
MKSLNQHALPDCLWMPDARRCSAIVLPRSWGGEYEKRHLLAGCPDEQGMHRKYPKNGRFSVCPAFVEG